MKVYLADLDYFTEGNRIETPLGIGFIKSYCQPQFPEVEFKLFKNPDLLIDAIRTYPPDILGLSCFVWNMKLNEKIIEIARKTKPDIYIVAGGPNSQLFTEADGIVIGPGEFAFLFIIQDILADREPIIEPSMFVDPPSPYLNGILDEFMDLLPIVETVRGCPYKCGYCSGGTGKIKVRDKEIVKREIDYLEEKSEHRAIDLSDTNFGIGGNRDLEIIEYIRDKFDKTGFPHLAGYATSRNKSDMAIKVVEAISDVTGELYFGLQTLTDKALDACNRKNLDWPIMIKLIDKAKAANRPVCVDLIFGLPYETLESFLGTLNILYDIGIKAPVIYQLRLLPFTDFWYKRDEYGFETRFRSFNGRYGIIDNERIVEAEEIVVASNWFSFDDYITLRTYGLLATLGEYGVFDISPKDMVCILAGSGDRLNNWLNDYKDFASKELFNSAEDVYNCNPEEFFKLNLGFAGYAIFEDRRILEGIGDIIGAEPKPAPEIENKYSNLPVYKRCERILLYSPRSIWR